MHQRTVFTAPAPRPLPRAGGAVAAATVHLRRAALLALAAAAATAPGCSASKHSAPAPVASTPELDRDGVASVGLRLEWTGYAPVVRGGRLATFNVLGDAIAVEDSHAVCSLLSVAGGDVRWSTPLGDPTTRFVGNVRSGSRIAACSESEVFLLDTLTGNIVGRQRLQHVATTAPAQIGDLLVFGGAGPVLFAHALSSGYAAWSYGVRGPVESPPIALRDALVAAATRSGDVLIIDAPNGSAATRARIFDGPGGDIAGSDTTAFIASRDQSVYAFREGDSRALWRTRTDSALTGSITFHQGRVFTVVPSRGLSAFDAANGKALWAIDTVHGSVVGVHNGRLLTWDGQEAALVDAASGEVFGHTALPGADRLVPDRFEMSTVYALTPAGEIRKFNVK